MLKSYLMGTVAGFVCFAPPRETGGGGGNDNGGDNNSGGDGSVENDILEGLELSDADFQQDDVGDGEGDDGQLDPDGAGLGDIGDPDNRVTHTRRGQDDRQPPRRDGRQPQQQPQPRLPVRAEVKADARGNLVDGQGKVVARAGKEARLYQDAHNARTQVAQFQGQLRQAGTKLQDAVRIATELNNENQAYRAHSEALKTFNLKPEELLEAARQFTELRAEPLVALRKLLTRAAANGTNIAQLGEGVGNAVDTKSIVELIRSEMQPVRTRMTQEQEREAATREANDRLTQDTAKVRSFFEQNPEAVQYGEVFLKVLQTEDGKSMSLSHIYDRIRLNLLLNGGKQSGREQNPDRPTGRRAPDGSGNRRIELNEAAPTSASYDSIIRDLIPGLNAR